MGKKICYAEQIAIYFYCRELKHDFKEYPDKKSEEGWKRGNEVLYFCLLFIVLLFPLDCSFVSPLIKSVLNWVNCKGIKTPFYWQYIIIKPLLYWQTYEQYISKQVWTQHVQWPSHKTLPSLVKLLKFAQLRWVSRWGFLYTVTHHDSMEWAWLKRKMESWQ